MPILKYACDDCGKEFAKIVTKPDTVPTTCTVCGAVNIREAGPAFDYENKDLNRLLCVSCETCETCEESSDGCGSC